MHKGWLANLEENNTSDLVTYMVYRVWVVKSDVDHHYG